MFPSWPLSLVAVFVAVAALVFGVGRIPDIAGTLGRGLRLYRKTRRDLSAGVEDAVLDVLEEKERRE